MKNSTIDRAQAAEQFRQAQAGDRTSLNQLMDRHMGLVHYVLRRQASGPVSYADLLAAGREGLWHAILKYDPDRGVAFSTYASVAIARHIWQVVARAQRERPEPDLPRSGAAEPDTDLIVQEVEAALKALVGALPERQAWIVCAYYGVEGHVAHTQAQLGECLGCTRQAIGYHLQRALAHLRHPAFSAGLRALLGRNRRRDYVHARGSSPRRGR